MTRGKAPAGPARRIDNYLKESGWDAARLANLCGLHKTAVSKFRLRHRWVSIEAAAKLETGTRRARDNGLTDAVPILASELRPELIGVGANDDARKAG